MSNDDNKPKPIDFGFGDDFPDLSGFAPKPSGAKPPAKKTKQSPKPRPTPTPVKPQDVQSRAGQGKPAVLAQREAASDQIAKTLGFSSREMQPPMLKKRRRTQHYEPVDQLSIRGPVRVLNQFITYCEETGCSYWEALEQLLVTNPSPNPSKK